ncbi:MAG: YdbL family protein [Sphingomonadales bacterium]|nr:YdbL family protein [Sphingomonadales bacterium]MBD3775017.1 YdbL family protein [Paracoccaceae bacterium]
MQTMKTSLKLAIAGAAAAMALGGVAGVALAQRDPAYEAARKSGAIGERTDGYLGVVGAETPELKRMVADLNIKRRAIYADKAQAANATLEEYSLTAGCIAISRTVPGEKYQAPDGTWQTRTAGAPMLDARCPKNLG